MGRISAISPDHFSSFGDLLKHLRKQAGLTQRELSIAVGYSDAQISRMEQNQRVPDAATLTARFVSALHLEREPEWVKCLLELAADANRAEGPAPTADVSAPVLPRHNLPLKLTSFIGREKEIAGLKKQLKEHRLVTLTGSGGIGKTRLSIQIAHELLPQFSDGVWLVELAPLTDPALMPQAVCAVLGVQRQPQSNIPLLAVLTDYVREKTLLLILDNCEHLIDACAQLAEYLLAHCPNVRLLASSREALGVDGETSVRVPSLSLPSMPRPSLDTLQQSEAVQLFVERATLALPGFALTDANAPAIVQVCQRLDGIALAIELAAARVKLLKVEQIASRLEDVFHLLTGGTRTALPRQQTLRATIDWSYNLLSDAERVLLRRLAVFAGGWTLEAAESVCAGEDVDQYEVLNLLTQLANKSLVDVEREQGAEARYWLLETTRQYARKKLQESGEIDSIWRRHAEYYLALIEAAGGQSSVLDVLEPWDWQRYQVELGNLRVALTWSNSSTGDAELGLRLAGPLYVGFGVDWSERRGWLERALIQADAEGVDYPPARARVLFGLGFELVQHAEFAAGEDQLAHSVKIFQDLGDRLNHAAVLFWLGWSAHERNDAATARLLLEEQLALCRELGKQRWIAHTLASLALVAVIQEDAMRATTLVEEAQVLHRQLGHTFGIVRELNFLGYIAQLQGDYERAVQFQSESLALSRTLDPNSTSVAHVGHGLGEAALAAGDVALATECFIKVLTSGQRWQLPRFQIWSVASFAGVAAINGEPERAAKLWGAAEAQCQSTGLRPACAIRVTHKRLQAEARGQLGDSAFNAAWVEGQKMTLEQAVAYALADPTSKLQE